MRSVRRVRAVLAIRAPALLAAVVGIGCSGRQASSQEIPDRPEPVVSVAGDGLLPGDRRLPGGAATVTTAVPARPIGKTSSPVPADHTPETRPPLVSPGVETTTAPTG
jgi:hypothetical protein